jgi:hypothetical protein
MAPADQRPQVVQSFGLAKRAVDGDIVGMQ